MTSPQVSVDAVPENVTTTVTSSEHPLKSPGKSHITMVVISKIICAKCALCFVMCAQDLFDSSGE